MGILRFENGDMYLGGFESGKMHGFGSFVQEENGGLVKTILKGEIANNEFQDDGSVNFPCLLAERASKHRSTPDVYKLKTTTSTDRNKQEESVSEPITQKKTEKNAKAHLVNAGGQIHTLISTQT